MSWFILSTALFKVVLKSQPDLIAMFKSHHFENAYCFTLYNKICIMTTFSFDLRSHLRGQAICIVRSSNIFHPMLYSLRLEMQHNDVSKNILTFVRRLHLHYISGQFGCYYYYQKLPNELLIINYIIEQCAC